MNLSSERRAALTARADEYAANITPALPYLAERGIDADTADRYGLGVVTDGTYKGRLSIPYYTPAGVVQIKYRCMKHPSHKGIDCPKYLYDTGTGHYLYNAHVLMTTADTVVLTEGELDALSVEAFCDIPAVGYPGVDTWREKPHWPLCFEGVGEVLVLADGDDAGRKAAKRVADSIGYRARVVDLPDGGDANSLIAAEGAAAFLQRLEQ